VGDISNPEDLDRLVAALRAPPDDTVFDAAHLAEISERLQAEVKKAKKGG
jgi:hypothetical protein